MTEPIGNDSSSNGQSGHVTLLDLFLFMSGGWAIPFAVVAILGDHTAWKFPAILLGAALSVFWGWHCKILLWLIDKKLFTQTLSHSPRRALAVYLGVFGLSLSLQYALYRVIRFALGIVVTGA
jgi:hypothetical protein